MASREQEVVALPQAADPPARSGLWAEVVHRLTYPFRRGEPPATQPATGFYTDTTVCIGCKACEVACKQWNQLPADGFEFTGNSYDNTGRLSAESWRHVKFVEQFADVIPPRGDGRMSLDVLAEPPPANRWLMMSDVCKHCAAAPCQHACPTGAILYNEFANVYIQPDICNGCAYCIAACPFGVITRSHFDGHAHKCTLCYDRQKDGLVPACAKACPTASIQFGPVDELREKARKRVEELPGRGVPGAYLYGDAATETYTELHSFYLLADRPAVYGLPDTPVNPWVHMRGDYLRATAAGLAALVALVVVLLVMGVEPHPGQVGDGEKSSNLTADRRLMWETQKLGGTPDPSHGPNPRSSTDQAIDAASRVFNTVEVVGKTREEVIVLLGDPRASNDSIYNFPFWPAPKAAMVYRFDSGAYGWQFNVVFGDDGKVREVKRYWIH